MGNGDYKKTSKKIHKQDVQEYFNQIDEIFRVPLAVCNVLYLFMCNILYLFMCNVFSIALRCFMYCFNINDKARCFFRLCLMRLMLTKFPNSN